MLILPLLTGEFVPVNKTLKDEGGKKKKKVIIATYFILESKFSSKVEL